MNMISGTGRMPAIAAPTDAPMIASSAIGRVADAVLTVLGRQPLGDVEHAAAGRVGHVLAHEDDARIRGHGLVEGLVDGLAERGHLARLGLGARLRVGLLRLGVDVAGHGLRIGGRVGRGLLVGRVDLGDHPGLDVGQRGLVGLALFQQPGAVARHRVVGLLGLEAIGVHVLVLVAQHVAERAEGDALEQHRSLAAPGVLDGLLGRGVGGHGISCRRPACPSWRRPRPGRRPRRSWPCRRTSCARRTGCSGRRTRRAGSTPKPC